MSKPNRREFLGQLGAAAVVLPHWGSSLFQVGWEHSHASAAPSQASAPTYELLIAGGRVIDPSQKLASAQDVAIADGKIARIASNIPRAQARQVFDATGKIVTPGFIDLHTHVFEGVAGPRIDPDLVGNVKGVTTLVDAGSAGATTFPGFRKHVIERASTRVYEFLNFSTVGMLGNNLYDPGTHNAKATIGVIQQNRDRIMGIKVQIRGRHDDLAYDVKTLKQAREVADATGVPIMLHWTNETELLGLLKKGDIMTHPFNPPSPNSSNLVGGQGAKILPQILELRDRGIFTDFAHGGTHHSWEVAEKAVAQGWYPDTISTDIHAGAIEIVVDLPTTMSKFLFLGMPLEQVIERVTANPAKVLPTKEQIGTVAPGSVADVTILDVMKVDVQLLDSTRQPRTGHQKVVTVATVAGGKLVPGKA